METLGHHQQQIVHVLDPRAQTQLLEYTLKKLTIELSHFQFDHCDLVNLLNQSGWQQHRLQLFLLDYYSPPDYDMNSLPQTTCLICYSPIDYAYHESCGHVYCIDCYQMHVQIQFQKGIQCLKSRCPSPGCPKSISRSTYRRFLSDQQYSLFEKHLVESMVVNNPALMHCPGKACRNVLHLQELEYLERDSIKQQGVDYQCLCGYYLCLVCKEEGHQPMNCETFHQFQGIAMNSNNLDYLWKEVNSKKCPRCSADIQKVSGCMKMKCFCCDHTFCWLCLQEWAKHNAQTGGFYLCNMVKEDKVKNKDINHKQKQLQQLEHYADRFFEHRKSHDEAIRKKKEVLRLFSRFIGKQDQGAFLQKALQLIIESRRVISNTYGQAFFLNDPAKKSFLQFLQSELEGQLEALDNLTDQLGNVQEYPRLFSHGQVNGFYYQLKDSINGLSLTLEQYFSNILVQLQNGLPEITAPAQDEADDQVPAIDETSQFWRCSTCTFVNEDINLTLCQVCQSQRE